MTYTVKAIESSRNIPITLTVIGVAETVLSGGNPRVSIVLHSDEGAYMGHLELTTEGGNILGESLRNQAEVASRLTEKKED